MLLCSDIVTDCKIIPHEKCNYITNNIIIGSYPTVKTLKILEDYGVDVFIDLRTATNYETHKEKYHFPIGIGKPPTKKQAKKILQIISQNENKLIYIHCKAGHGRAGTIGAYLIGKLYKLDTCEAVAYIEQQRNTRIDKTKNYIPTPETTSQISFLIKEIGLKKNNTIPDRTDKSWLSINTLD